MHSKKTTKSVTHTLFHNNHLALVCTLALSPLFLLRQECFGRRRGERERERDVQTKLPFAVVSHATAMLPLSLSPCHLPNSFHSSCDLHKFKILRMQPSSRDACDVMQSIVSSFQTPIVLNKSNFAILGAVTTNATLLRVGQGQHALLNIRQNIFSRK